jgi:hypothetical protein
MKRRVRILPVALGALAWVAGGGTSWSFYNPSTGRWLNRDLAGEPAENNGYAFARSCPVLFCDSDGRAPAPLLAADGRGQPPVPDVAPCTWLGWESGRSEVSVLVSPSRQRTVGRGRVGRCKHYRSFGNTRLQHRETKSSGATNGVK